MQMKSFFSVRVDFFSTIVLLFILERRGQWKINQKSCATVFWTHPHSYLILMIKDSESSQIWRSLELEGSDSFCGASESTFRGMHLFVLKKHTHSQTQCIDCMLKANQTKQTKQISLQLLINIIEYWKKWRKIESKCKKKNLKRAPW